jgi:hypothetical protein
VLLACTRHSVFPWFEPPLTSDKHLTDEAQILFQHLSSLASTPLIHRLVSFWRAEDLGLTYMSLEIFAFFVSWLRRFCCPDERLLLSQEILSKLKVALCWLARLCSPVTCLLFTLQSMWNEHRAA